MAQEGYVPFNTVQSSGAEPARENIQATPADFGGSSAEATQKLGGTLQSSGQQFGQTALQYQDLTNQADARNTLSQYTPEMAKAWSSYGTLQGKAASDALPGFLQNLQDIQKKYADSLQSPMARNNFMEASSYLTNRLSLMSSEHAAQQQKSYWVEQARANAANMTTTATLFMNDPQTIDSTTASIAHSAQQQADLQNMSPDATQALVGQQVGKHVATIVETQAATNPDLALQTFNRLKSQMDGASIEHVTQFLKPILRNRQGDADLNTLMNGGGGAPSGTGNGTPGANPAVVQQIKTSAADNGVPVDQALTIAHIESHTGTASDRAGSQYHGIYQMGTNERASVGLSDSDDDVTQAKKGVQYLSQAYKLASSAVGQPAEGWQTYMVHQQGSAGGPALLTADPGASAVSTLRSAGSANPVAAVTQNGGTADMTVGQFLNVWKGKYDNAATTVGATSGAPSSGTGTLPGGLSPGASTMPDWSALRGKAIDQFAEDPERLTTVLSKLGQTQTRMEGATAAQRRILEHGEAGTEQALLDGLPVAIPEDTYHQVFPPDEADRRLTNLHVAQTAGEILQGVKWGSPAQVSQVVSDLSSGLGTFSDQIRSRVSGLKGAATVTSPGGDGQQAPVVETPEAYGLRKFIADKAVKQIASRAEALRTDPGGYVMAEPTVSAAAKGVDPNNPQTVSNFVNTTLGIQDHLGVPEAQQHILSAQQAQSQSAALTNPNIDQGQQLSNMAKQWGDSWPKVYGDLVTLGKMPASAQVLSMIPDPVARNDFQNMQKMATEKGGIAKLHELAGKSNMSAIDDAIDTEPSLLDFTRTANIPGIYNNAEGIYNIKDGIKNLAAYYTIRGEASGTAALKKAAAGVIDSKYDFDGYLRAPKGQLAPIENYGDSIKGSLKPEDLAAVQGRGVAGVEQSPDASINQRVQTDVVRPINEQAARDSFREVQRTGRWVTNESDSGAFLIAQDKNGVPYRVMGNDGKRIEFSFKDAIKGNLPVTGPVQVSPAGVPPAQTDVPLAIP